MNRQFELAYAAGFIDADGSIFIASGGSWKKGGSAPGKQGGGRQIPDEEWARRELLREQIQGLNARNYLERLAA